MATDLNNLAMLLYSQAKYEEAEALYRQAMDIDIRALGRDHPGVATDLNNLAGLLKATGRTAEAKKMGLEALAIVERALGPDHPDTTDYREWWGA